MFSNRLSTALAAAILLVWPAWAEAQDRDGLPAALDAFAHRAMSRIDAVPGMAVAVVDRQGALQTAGYGIADVETRAPVTAETRFYIASSTKAFTALAVAAIAARGEVDLDAPLAAWSPTSGVPAEIAGRITLTDLLSHRSGVNNEPIAFRVAYSGDWTPDLLWRLTAETRPREDVTHGQFAYSNAGYNLATVLLEREFGRDWRALVQDEVLTPLGMSQTTAFIDEARAGGEVVAAGHLALIDGPPQRSYLQKTDATMQSAGGLISTAHDMALWLQAQIDDGRIAGRQVLPVGLVASTHERRVAQEATFGEYVRTGYGLGWQIGRYGDEVLMHHFGNFAGSRAHVSFMPDRGVGVAVMVNEDVVAGDLADLVAKYAYDWLAGRPDVDAVYDEKIAGLVATRDARRQGFARSVQARAARPRTLTQPDAAYDGDYVSPALGLMRIRATSEGLEAAIGVQHARAENFTDPESIRVELTPLSGEPIVFTLDPSGRPVALIYDGRVFERR